MDIMHLALRGYMHEMKESIYSPMSLMICAVTSMSPVSTPSRVAVWRDGWKGREACGYVKGDAK
jgi:hypothetical protein